MNTVEILKILLIGQPNVGKSSLLNALVGPRVTVSNYPGTTVEITEAEKTFRGFKIRFVDTPGIYSFSDRSEEEKITEKVLFEGEKDGAVIVADSSSLERSLYLVLQVLEAKIPVIIALNFIEEAENKGIKIDSEKLAKLLGVPVVTINPFIKEGINDLINSLSKIKENNEVFNVEYDDHIESAINKVCSNVKFDSGLSKRFIAIRILEEDEDFYKFLENCGIVAEIKKNLIEHPKIAEDISINRYGIASFIAEKVTSIVHLREKKTALKQEKIDSVFLHKAWGPLATALFLLIVFGILLCFGNLMQDFLMGLTERFSSFFVVDKHPVATTILIQGLTGAAAGISIAVPYVFLFYLLLSLLEDIGILSRFLINAERFLKKINLSGKAFIPLILGLGCTVPAIRSTRVLASKKEQFHAASLFAFVPCSSRIAIIMGIVGFYGGTKLAFAVLIASLIAGLIWAFGINKIIHIESRPLLLELPPYRKPLIKNVLAKSWIRMKDFVYIVIPLLALGGAAYGILEDLGLVEYIAKPFSPIVAWLGLPYKTIIPLMFGFLQKDLTGAMLLSALGNELSLVLTPLQIFIFGLTATIGIPCIIALGMLIKEFGFKRAVLLTGASVMYGVFFAGLIRKLILIF